MSEQSLRRHVKVKRRDVDISRVGLSNNSLVAFFFGQMNESTCRDGAPLLYHETKVWILILTVDADWIGVGVVNISVDSAVGGELRSWSFA